MILLPLLIFDMVYLSCALITIFDRLFLPIPVANPWVDVYIIRPLIRVSMASSIFLTIALAHERLCAVTNPIQHRVTFLSPKNRRCRLFKCIFIGILLSVVLNATVFWEMNVIYDKSNPPIPIQFVPSDLRINPYFSLIYVNVIRLVALGIFPLSSLAVSYTHLTLPTKA